MGLLGAFLAPFSALLLLMGIRFSHVATGTGLPESSVFFFLHVALPMAGYALFTAATAVAAAWFIEARQLKRGHLGFIYSLPPLEILEGLAFRLCAWGWAGLTLGLVAGIVKNGGLPGLNAKAAMSLGAWSYYGAALLLHRTGFRGRRFTTLLLAGFGALFFGYYLVNVYWGGHGIGAER